MERDAVRLNLMQRDCDYTLAVARFHNEYLDLDDLIAEIMGEGFP